MSDSSFENVNNEGKEKASTTVQLSHEELVKLTREAIEKLLESDILLHGLPTDATVEEIRGQAAVAQGQAITLYLNRGKLPTLSIVVSIWNALMRIKNEEE